MRIITDYWDYYDGVQAWQGDTNDLYIRRRFPNGKVDDYKRDRLGNHVGNPYRSENSTNTDTIALNIPQMYRNSGIQFIGFCGKIYPVSIKHKIKQKTDRYRYGDDWTVYDGDDSLINNDMRIRYDIHEEIIEDHTFLLNEHINYVDHVVNSNQVLSIFKEKKVPIFVLKTADHGAYANDEYIINYAPMLSKYRFSDIFNAYTAFQEIEWFFANVIYDRENPDPQITDNKVLRDAKGFNNKSFKHRK